MSSETRALRPPSPTPHSITVPVTFAYTRFRDVRRRGKLPLHRGRPFSAIGHGGPGCECLCNAHSRREAGIGKCRLNTGDACIFFYWILAHSGAVFASTGRRGAFPAQLWGRGIPGRAGRSLSLRDLRFGVKEHVPRGGAGLMDSGGPGPHPSHLRASAHLLASEAPQPHHIHGTWVMTEAAGMLVTDGSCPVPWRPRRPPLTSPAGCSSIPASAQARNPARRRLGSAPHSGRAPSSEWHSEAPREEDGETSHCLTPCRPQSLRPA